MNKLKWNQLSEKLKINIPFYIKKKDSYFQSFKFDEKIIFSFLDENLLIFKIYNNIDENNNLLSINITLSNYFILSFLNIDENIIKILQNKLLSNKFLFLSNKRKIYIIQFSYIDYYFDIKITINFEKNEEIISFIDNIIFVTKEKNLYEVAINYENNKIEKKMIYSGNRILNCDIIKNENINIIFTDKEILLINYKKGINEIIFKDNTSFNGFVFENKIVFLKSKDEIVVNDLENNKNNLSLKFNSKKILNKFDFNKVIFSDEKIILILNSTEIELYLYNLQTGQFNRESTILEHKSIICFQNFVLMFTISKEKMIIKGKYCIFNKILNKNNNNNELKDEDNSFFDSFNLEQIEQKFEEKFTISKKNLLKIEKNKKKINFLINRINIQNYLFLKEKIKKFLSIILYYSENFNLNEYINYISDIKFTLVDFYIFNFGDSKLFLNYKQVYLIMLINIYLQKSKELLKIAEDTYDYDAYIYLYNYIKNLKNLI